MRYFLRRDGPEDSPRLREVHTPEEVVHPSWTGYQWEAVCRTATASNVLIRRYGFEITGSEPDPGDEAPPPTPKRAVQPADLRAIGVDVVEPAGADRANDWQRWRQRAAKKRAHVCGAEVGDLWQRLRGRVAPELLALAAGVARSGAWADAELDVGVVKPMHGFGERERQAVQDALDAAVALGPRCRVVVVQNDSAAAPAFRAWVPRANADRYLPVVTRNDGYAAACNAGAKRLRTSRWLLFTQPDARWSATEVRDAVGLSLALREGPVGFGRPALVGPSGGTCDDPYNGVLVEWGRNVWRHRGMPPQPVDWLAGYWLLADGATFREVGGWNERFFLYYEDPDLSLRMAHAGCRPVAWPGLAVEHERGGTIRSRVEESVISEMQGESRATFGAIWGGR